MDEIDGLSGLIISLRLH